MAIRRMISRSLIDTDIFLDLSTEAKALYLFFNIYADDDGMVGNPKSISRISGISASFINELSECGYIIRFNSGVIAIKHWLVHNLIRKDRYTPTLFKKEYDCLCV
ncbi:MAG: DNA replication protein, partial [Clostridia bacterium]|nr:DNA replication protein [Clostridia bacterium]